MSEELSDYTTSNLAHVVENGSEEEIRMLLGGRERIRPAGIIRVGKKRPLDRCTAQEKAQFEQLEAEGLSYDDIDRKIGGKPKTRESKLTTQNTDHFVIRECDFKKASDAAFILKNYADPDGKVRRIPVFFTVSELDQAIPHGYTAFDGAARLRCKSFYDGDALKFRYLEKSVTVPKASDWKVLDSDDEDEAKKACGYDVKFSGMFRVNVVGLRGIGEVVIPNKSWNGMGDAVAVLNRVKKRLGRFDGLLNGQHYFEICKVQEYVKHEGKKVKQWIVTIELSVDPMEIERYSEPALVAARAQNALKMLTGFTPPPVQKAVSPAPPVPVEEIVEPVEEPEPAEVATPSRTFAPVDPRDELKPAITAIEGLAAKAQIPAEEVWAVLVDINLGTATEDLTIEEMRLFYTDIQKELVADRAKFAAKAHETFTRMSARHDELPPLTGDDDV